MSIWKQYPEEQREQYIRFLQMYGALTNLFKQKSGKLIPYLDSKFQETVFARTFKSENVDIGNTPHDVLSILGGKRIGIGLKTWMDSKPSYQKVMQLKRYQNEINEYKDDDGDLACKISSIKNERMERDYKRLGLSANDNIYHYITRDKGLFSIHECAYPLIDLGSLSGFKKTNTAFSWTDGNKEYKYTFGDSQIWQNFDQSKYGTLLLHKFDVEIIDDPFSFLLEAYTDICDNPKASPDDIVEVYLPLYSYRSQEVPVKSGLNAWNAAPKNKGSNTPRPLNEVYIPIPREFHNQYPSFFVKDIFKFEEERNSHHGSSATKPEIRFYLQLPNGDRMPSLVTQDNMKALQSGSNTEHDSSGKRYGQSALGQWLLIDVLGLNDRTKVTREWLVKRGTDSVRLWRKKDDYSVIHIDFAPVDSFEKFMKDEDL